MNRERWRQVKGLLALALEQPPEHRRAFLTEAAAGDADLLGELSSLMDAHDRPTGFSLEHPPPLMTSWEPLDDDRVLRSGSWRPSSGDSARSSPPASTS